jgi:acyl dehydratase
MSQPLYFEDVEVGDTWVSTARTITETDVVMFAGLTGDYNPLHVDHEYVKGTPFKKPIAHGLLGVALVAGLGNHAPLVKTVAFVSIQEWQFLKAIYIGETVHIHTEAIEKVDRGRRRGQISWKRRLMSHAGEPLQSGIFVSLVEKRGASENSTA